MKPKKKGKTAVRVHISPEKEAELQRISGLLTQAGYVIRREKLKQGHGWKTVSGNCRVHEQKVVFVDKKAPIEDQLLFLQTLAKELVIT